MCVYARALIYRATREARRREIRNLRTAVGLARIHAFKRARPFLPRFAVVAAVIYEFVPDTPRIDFSILRETYFVAGAGSYAVSPRVGLC